MSHDVDAADAALLAAGDHARLLAKYEPTIIGRCIARLHGHLDADDVAQDIKIRLWRELQAGKRYPSVPYRVVVHQVIGWTLNDYFAGRRTDVPLSDEWDPADPSDALDELADRDVVASALETLDEGATRQVMELRYLERLEIAEIAGQLGMTRNAVDQALSRGHRKLRKTLSDG